MDGSDFHASLPMSSLLHLFIGAHLRQTDARISLVSPCSQCQARHGLGPRGVSAPLAIAQHRLLPAGGPNPSALWMQWRNLDRLDDEQRARTRSRAEAIRGQLQSP